MRSTFCSAFRRIELFGALAVACAGFPGCSSRVVYLGEGDGVLDVEAGGSAGSTALDAGQVPPAADSASGGAQAAKGRTCVSSSDCVAPLVCAGGRCHVTCDPAVGCQEGHYQLLPCLTEFAAVPVCPLPCDTGWGADSTLCAHAGEPDDGPPGLYECGRLPLSQPPASGDQCTDNGAPCSYSCNDGTNTLRQDCDRGVCNCTLNGQLACRCVTTQLPFLCSFCCDL